MAVRSVEGVVDWILGCPTIGRPHRRLASLMIDLRDLLERHKLQYTVSMYIRVCAYPDDGVDGIRSSTSFPAKWFALQPLDAGYEVSTGRAHGVVSTGYVAGDQVRTAVADALAFLTSAPGDTTDEG
jgi:hypothetical protein